MNKLKNNQNGVSGVVELCALGTTRNYTVQAQTVCEL